MKTFQWQKLVVPSLFPPWIKLLPLLPQNLEKVLLIKIYDAQLFEN